MSEVKVSKVDPEVLTALIASQPRDERFNVGDKLETEYVETRPAYKHQEAMDVAGVRKRLPQEKHKH